MRTKSLYMMWNFILPIFLFAKACFGETDCSENPFELCPYPQLFSMIPKTASEYSKICPDLPNYIKCLRKFQKTCNSMVFFDSDEEYESLHEFYSELCEEGSLFNTIVIENLKCLNETLDSSHCSDETQTLIHEFKSVETANEDDDSEHLPVDIACLKGIYEAACTTADLSKKCGSIVKETAYDVIRRSNFIEYNCPSEFAKRLLDDPKVIEMQTKYQDFFYSLMGKYTEEDFGSGLL